jgi:hypothetical protein
MPRFINPLYGTPLTEEWSGAFSRRFVSFLQGKWISLRPYSTSVESLVSFFSRNHLRSKNMKTSLPTWTQYWSLGVHASSGLGQVICFILAVDVWQEKRPQQISTDLVIVIQDLSITGCRLNGPPPRCSTWTRPHSQRSAALNLSTNDLTYRSQIWDASEKNGTHKEEQFMGVYIYVYLYIYIFIHTKTTHYITITYMVLLCITSLVASAIPHKLVTWGTSTGVPLWWSFITLVTHLLHCILPLSPRQNVNQHQSRLLYVHDYRLFMMIVWNCMIIDYCALLYTIIH